MKDMVQLHEGRFNSMKVVKKTLTSKAWNNFFVRLIADHYTLGVAPLPVTVANKGL